MKKIAALLSLVFGLLSFSPALAAEFISPRGGDPNVSVGTGETRRNLYAAGSNVYISGNISGDLVAAGSMVSVDGAVEDDVMAAGGTVLVSGPVGGDARIAGGNVTITGTIAGDLVVGGGNITISERSSIGGDLIIGAGNVVVNSPVRGNLKLAGGTVILNSRVEGEVRANVSDKLTFGPRADIQSKVFYRATQKAEFQGGSSVPNAEYSRIEKRELKRGAAAIFTAAFLIKLIAWMLASWLWLHFRKSNFMGIVESVRTEPWTNLAFGAAALILTPIAAFFMLLTVVGYYVSIIVLLAYILTVVVVNVISALALGELVLRYLNKPGEGFVNWQVVALGVVLWHVLGFIPVVGWVIKGAVFIIVLGAATQAIRDKILVKQA